VGLCLLAAAVQVVATTPAARAQATSVQVLEYYNATLDSYFITGRANEQAALDALNTDFRRTGMSFAASTAGSSDSLVRICRFYINLPATPGPFASTHFYGRERIDCEAIQAQAPAGFSFEGYDFTVSSPVAGACPAAAPVAVYRSFRAVAGGRTSNHRYSTSNASYQAMLAAGWTGEGIAFCATAGSDAAALAEASFKRVLTGGSATPSPFTPGCDAGQTGTSYLGSEVEPSLAINPANPQHLVAAWQQDRWSNGGSRGIASSASVDGGKTWVASRAAFSRCGGGAYDRATDPWVTIAADGVAFQMALGFGGVDFTPSSVSAMMVARSTDGGLSWGTPTTLIRDTGASFFNDKNMMVADPLDRRYAYAVWGRLTASDGGPAYFARTVDGGLTWETARSIYDPGAGNQTFGNVLLVRHDGSVMHIFVDIIRSATASSTTGVFIRAARSIDHGLTWSAPVTIASNLGIATTHPNTGRVRDGNGLVSVAESPSGKLWVTWQDARYSQGARNAIALSSSSNGSDWTAPVRVNARDDVGAFSPTIAVRPDGTLGISFYDLREATIDAPLRTVYRLITSAEGTFWRESGIESVFDYTQAPFANGWFTGDYFGLVGRGTTFGALYGQVTGDGNNRTDIVYANLAEGSLKRGAAYRAVAMPADSAVNPQLRDAAMDAANRAARSRYR